MSYCIDIKALGVKRQGMKNDLIFQVIIQLVSSQIMIKEEKWVENKMKMRMMRMMMMMVLWLWKDGENVILQTLYSFLPFSLIHSILFTSFLLQISCDSYLAEQINLTRDEVKTSFHSQLEQVVLLGKKSNDE